MTDRWIKPKWPEVTDNYQIEVFESKSDRVQDFGNGMVLGTILIFLLRVPV